MFKKISTIARDKLLEIGILFFCNLILAYFFVYYIVVSSSLIVYALIILGVSVLCYLLLFYLGKKYAIDSFQKNIYTLPIIGAIFGTLLFTLFVNLILVSDKVDYYSYGINFIQNIPKKNITAIEKKNGKFILNKVPQINHPYMGILPFGQFNSVDRFLVEMEGTLKGESQLGIVFLKDGKMPTEYIELLASTTKDSVSLNNVDGKNKYPISGERVPIYEQREFKLFIDYRKNENRACIYYNSIYSKLFNETCVDLPDNINLQYVGFKMVDDDIDNNNLKVPEISKFVVYSLRF